MATVPPPIDAAQALQEGVIRAGQDIQFTNQTLDAPTIYCDGFKGLTITSNVTKVSFFEQILDPFQEGVPVARFVVNLAIPNDQLVPVANLLKQVADMFASGDLLKAANQAPAAKDAE